MSNEKRRQYFIEAGLPDLHIEFAERFLDADTPTRQVAVIPTGGGRGHFLLTLAAFVASQGGRVLFLADRVILIEQYRHRLEHTNISAVSLDRQTMRSLQAGAAIPRVQWRNGNVYLATTQFATAADVKSQILRAKWDLVVVDDARSSKLLTELKPSSSYKRLLILLTHFTPTEKDLTFQGADVQVLGTLNPALQPKFELEIIEFVRSENELQIIKDVLLLVKQLPKDLDPELRSKVMRQRTASSFYALELTLARLRPTIQAQRNIAAHNLNSDAADLPQLMSTLQLIDRLLIQLDELERDSKQEAFSHLLERLTGSHVVVYTNSMNTVNYLVQLVTRAGKQAHQVIGAMSYLEYEGFVHTFAESGGIAIVSDARRLLGYDLRAVLSTVVLYDVPSNEQDLFSLLSRMNPQGSKVYVMQDSNKTLGDSEKLMQDLLKKLGLDKK